MKTKTNLVFPVVVILMIIASFALISFDNKPGRSLGSISSSDSYLSTTTRATSASATASYIACLGTCQFGSLIVNQVGTAGYVRIWDATSTATTSYTLSKSGTYGRELVQVLTASDAAGTLVYDIVAETGVVVETSTGFDGQYTVTWKK